MLNRFDYIQHLIAMYQLDETYARWALSHYDESMPWLELNQGVREALKEAK